ncbi:MAG TPA: hypothetical protein VGV60_01890 [Candidatus Polarisedimenticolia bacterium]|jgi:hypothetical protein|nr:hypothetical protein [Candidatus Polarisedimenticolia bacterium]
MRYRKLIYLPLLMAALFGETTTSAIEFATADGKLVTVLLPGVPVTLIPPPIVLSSYVVPESTAQPMSLETTSPTINSPLIWGYEAAETNAHLFAYTIDSPPTMVADCVPPGSINGRGVTLDPLDGNLWYSFVTFDQFLGDGLIHKTTPPNSGSCVEVDQIPFEDGPGGMIQDDIGALDVDGVTKHLWVAGYRAVRVGLEHRSYLYLVNRNSGKIIRSCWVPSHEGGVGNDSLTYARLEGLPGSGQYLLTDAGEVNTYLDQLLIVDAADCRGGVQATPVATFTKSEGMSGFDYEWPGLLDTENANLFNLGGQPFSSSLMHGPWGQATGMEDLGLCASKGEMNGSDNTCPY